MSDDQFTNWEWSVDEWTSEWTIRVGSAYACSTCGSMLMVTKGGVGVLEPKCCGAEMKQVETDETV